MRGKIGSTFIDVTSTFNRNYTRTGSTLPTSTIFESFLEPRNVRCWEVLEKRFKGKVTSFLSRNTSTRQDKKINILALQRADDEHQNM